MPQVHNPTYIVFSDFDETYYPHQFIDEHKGHIKLLEETLISMSVTGNVLFGLVTGANIDHVLEKMKHGSFQCLPHFIASDLGTEIRFFEKNNHGEVDLYWSKRLEGSQYDETRISTIIDLLRSQNILLTRQTHIKTNFYKNSFFYEAQNDQLDQRIIEKIRNVALEHKVAVSISKCNPLIGDPEGYYDVDFTPLHTGKVHIVSYMLKKYKLKKENGIAFGDSGNDIKMLKSVKHGYLLQNATEEAKSLHNQITESPYSEGIRDTLLNILGFPFPMNGG